LKEQDITRLEAHLKRTFGNPHINLNRAVIVRHMARSSAMIYEVM